MAKLSMFNFITLNGFYKGPAEDIGWHKHEGEEAQFSIDSAKADNMLLFGRVTYEMMIKFWPTPQAVQMMPEMAESMNSAEKIVFSNTLKKADWNNTRIISGDIVEEIKKLKQTSAKNMTILGSGSIISQFAAAGLIDEYGIMIDPIAIGEGTPIFKGIEQKLDLKLTSSRTFKSGAVLLSYTPV